MQPSNYEFSNIPTRLPKGNYIVMDPCFLFDDGTFWKAMCKYVHPSPGTCTNPFYINVDKHLIFAFSTRSGDGTFDLMQGRTRIGPIGVDAGMIALIPEEYAKSTVWGTILELPDGGIPQYNPVTGLFQIEAYAIQT